MSQILSVRGRITLFILVPLLLVAGIVGYFSYQSTRARAQIRFDDGLLATASAISRDIAASGGDALSVETRDLISDTSGGRVFYHVYAPDGVFVTGYATPPVSTQLSPEDKLQFYDARYHGSAVRVLRLREIMQIDGLLGTFNFTVWQNTSVREQFVRDQSLQTFIVISTLTASVGLIVWIGVGVGLRPLLDLQHAIAIRSSTDLTPIRRPVPDEVKGIVATLNSLLGQVNESMEAKNVFISNAAHQLRNPVAGIMAMAEAVKSAPDAESALERTADLYESAQQASDLANKLISFERANQAASADFHEALNVVTVLRSAKDNIQRVSPATVQINLIAQQPTTQVMGDSLMLEEAVTNLLDNALKYAGPELSTITITVSKVKRMVRIEISDDGVGMTNDEMRKAMERFGQVNPGRGSGLGLSIVQSVAKSHGGRFSLQPRDKGLTAILDLPGVPIFT